MWYSRLTPCDILDSERSFSLVQLPDGSIASLYPVQDNYINVGNNLRSPKSLTDLCIDAVCRSLPDLQGALPPGLPQDVVDDVIRSLIQHSALTATTLRVLRHCELGSLSLAGCRGVTDAWLEPLKCQHSPVSLPTTPPAMEEEDMYPMDLDHPSGMVHEVEDRPSNVFYGTFEKWEDHSCSTASFVSATEEHPPMDLAPTSSQEEEEEEEEEEEDHWKSDDPPMMTATLASSVTTNMTLLDIRGSHSLTDRGLMQLLPLTSLQVAKLDHCHSLTGRGLLALCHSHSLHTLSLANCRRLTDEAVINISHLSSIQALSLDGCRCLTDRSLAAISDLYRLLKLDLSQCDLITDQGLEHLEHLELLEELSLGWCRLVSDAGIDLLTQQRGRDRNLRVLRLARCSITDEGVGHLSRLLALEELDLNGCSNIGSSALGMTLGKLKHLTVLDVSYCPNIMYVLMGSLRSIHLLSLNDFFATTVAAVGKEKSMR
jgi:Leucine Rich repeat